MVLLSAPGWRAGVLLSAGRLGRGGYRARPTRRCSIRLLGMARCEQRYIENTAVLVSTMSDAHGNSIEITDFAPRFLQFERMFRPAVLIRRVRRMHGRPRITVRIKPLFGWGAQQPGITRGGNHVRYVGPEQTLRLTTDAPVSYILDETPFIVDRPISRILGPDETLLDEIEPTSRRHLERTIDHWHGWVRVLSIPFEWQDAVIRAAITLMLCNFEETGAIVAALTTSILEAPNTGRNKTAADPVGGASRTGRALALRRLGIQEARCLACRCRISTMIFVPGGNL